MVTAHVPLDPLAATLTYLLSKGALVSLPTNDTLHDTSDPAGSAGAKVKVNLAVTLPCTGVAANVGATNVGKAAAHAAKPMVKAPVQALRGTIRIGFQTKDVFDFPFRCWLNIPGSSSGRDASEVFPILEANPFAVDWLILTLNQNKKSAKAHLRLTP